LLLLLLYCRDLNPGPTPWATVPILFLRRVFWDRVSLGWLWT
jgi:hypothetical protein